MENRTIVKVRDIRRPWNKWRTSGHDDVDPVGGRDGCAPYDIETTLRSGAAAVLGMIAQVEGDPQAPGNAVGSIEAKLGHVEHDV